MKKIFFSIVAIAALAACTKSEVAYEQTDEIGFVAVANNITKAPVSGAVYPTGLNMYINAYVHATNVPTTPDYINNGEFTHRSTPVEGKEVWGGTTPYYWPNEQTLHFSGYSKSGSFTSASYNPSTDALTINGYTPGVGTELGANDLMWFPSTKYTAPTGYGKATKYVPVNMYHTCSWITFLVQGDATTGGTNSTYKINSLTMNGVDMTANVVCTGNAALTQNTLSTYVVWSENTTQTGDNTTYSVTLPLDGIELKSTCTTTTTDGNTTTVQTPKNIETGATTNATLGGNIVVIPQVPGTIDLAWSYKSTTTATISDTATGLSLALGSGLAWEPGKHYVYTITIKANEILIAPTPVDWVNDVNHGVTVE